MSTWTTFYVQTNDSEPVTQQLKELAGINHVEKGAFPGDDLYACYLVDENAMPDYLVIGKTQAGWVTVNHNSFNRLVDWGMVLSKKLNTKVILTMAQSVSDVYYFCLFDKGLKLREIEVCYSDDFTPINYGQKFDFEGEQPGSKQDYDGETEYYFGFEEIEQYCSHFGLTIQYEPGGSNWTILKNARDQPARSAKPWWKFW
ncbi:MAG: hypothetical protein ABIO79_14175 [Ferruginibacter sp.]